MTVFFTKLDRIDQHRLVGKGKGPAIHEYKERFEKNCLSTVTIVTGSLVLDSLIFITGKTIRKMKSFAIVTEIDSWTMADN